MGSQAERQRRMIEFHLAARGVTDRRVLDAMEAVPRTAFVPQELADQAYDDMPLPIGEGQTISQPFMVAWMIQALALRPDDKVLEIGAGSGYAAAVMSRLAATVLGVERNARLGERARRALAQAGCANVEIRIGDGSAGAPDSAPFNAILVSAAGPGVPESLKAQLAPDGRLVMPVGNRPDFQVLRRVVRDPDGSFREASLGEVRFVPLVGIHGWPEETE